MTKKFTRFDDSCKAGCKRFSQRKDQKSSEKSQFPKLNLKYKLRDLFLLYLIIGITA